ncbi:MAG TPA: PEP/pyruvate-binding domain-containing protein, partial [bacterium]|nr:PEP/pyruvate-binding domain-containing protein [bacterium]
GQFDSVLNVPTDGMREAYKQVIASRFTERAVLYRLIGGFTEVDTPMAVLFLPMIEARSAGVLYTRDPGDESSDRMLINSVWGLADGLVQGEAAADTFVASRERPGEIIEQRLPSRPAGTEAPGHPPGPSLSPADVKLLVETALRIEEHFGRPQDIEWVLTPGRKLMIVQSRRLRTEERRLHGGQSVESRAPLLDAGVTIFPGRAVGPAFVAVGNDDLAKAGEGVVLVVRQATPEIGAVLASLAGVIAEQGNPSGHAATLLREFGVPAVFGMKGALKIKSGQVISLDATHRRAYEGELWPEVRERVKARMVQARSGRPESPLHDLILTLNLTDPLAMSFRARNCKSVHDIVRFTHEKAVSAMFELGDEAGGRSRQPTWRLESKMSLNIYVLDLGGSLPKAPAGKRGTVKPEEIRSTPFKALWSGITDPAVSWAGRSRVSGAGFMSVMAASMADRGAAVRGLGGKNYLMVAPEYVNFNARLAYHFAMVDALVAEVAENNYVNFRFRGGGAGQDRRSWRALFLSRVLLQESFAVDRRGDLVTAWLSRYPREASEQALALLGRLMGCARQLDMLLDSEAAVNHFVERFQAGDYQAFL